MDKPYPNKPDTMGLKEYLILKVSQENQMPIPTVRLIIENQFRTAKEALTTDSINSVEIAGFGRFYFNKKAALRNLEKYIRVRTSYDKQILEPDLTETKKRNLLIRFKSLDNSEKKLKQKLGVWKVK